MALISVPQAARLAGCSPQHVYNAIARKELHPLPDMPMVVLRSEDVEEWAAIPKSKGGRPHKQKEPGQ